MIVVDANILIYLIIDGDRTEAACALREKEPDWRTTPLWEYEFGNALTLMALQKRMTLPRAKEFFRTALQFFGPAVMRTDPEMALQLAKDKKISFYDATYLSLAHQLEVPLVTEDKALRKAGGKSALSIQEFLN